MVWSAFAASLRISSTSSEESFSFNDATFSSRFYNKWHSVHGKTTQETGGTYGDARRARDRDDIVSLGEQPGEGDLARGRVVFLRNSLDAVDDIVLSSNCGFVLSWISIAAMV